MFPQTTCVDLSEIHSLFGSPLEGISVCRAAFLQLLGIGRARLARTKKLSEGKMPGNMDFLQQIMSKDVLLSPSTSQVFSFPIFFTAQ